MESADLNLGPVSLRLQGLSAPDLDLLRRRWGGFLTDSGRSDGPAIRFFDAGEPGWIPGPHPGDLYPLEVLDDQAGRWTVSYNFAVHRLDDGDWIAAVRENSAEPFERVLGNAVRFVAAHHATSVGGLALHAAAVLRAGRAYILAGPSNSGKTTAVGLIPGAVNLGDDLTLILPAPPGGPAAEGWVVPAAPFDNAERIDRMPPVGPHPLAGIFKLHQAAEHRLERPPAILAVAALISCASFAWAMPELAASIADTARKLHEAGLYAHLHFARDPGFARFIG